MLDKSIVNADAGTRSGFRASLSASPSYGLLLRPLGRKKLYRTTSRSPPALHIKARLIRHILPEIFINYNPVAHHVYEGSVLYLQYVLEESIDTRSG